MIRDFNNTKYKLFVLLGTILETNKISTEFKKKFENYAIECTKESLPLLLPEDKGTYNQPVNTAAIIWSYCKILGDI